MNGQYFGERSYTPDSVDETNLNANDPLENSDVIAGQPPAPVEQTMAHEAPMATNNGSTPALLSHEESEKFHMRWNEIQGKFVDEPRSAVQQADALVSEVIGQINRLLDAEHSSLESQWDKSTDASTEDLRMAIQRYRAFFNRLVV